MIGLVRATVICATLALGLTAAGAADKAFKRDDLADSAVKLEAQIKSEAGPVAKSSATLRTDADAAFRRSDFRVGLQILGQIAATSPEDSANWLRLAKTIFQIRSASSSEQTFLLERASTAAYIAYQRAGNQAEEADALAVIGRAMSDRKLWRPALDSLRLSLDMREVAEVRGQYEKMRAEHGFRLLDYTVDFDGASPRACFQFSEDLAKRVDFAPFLAHAGTDKPALTGEGKQLCVDGLKHGERYNINLRAGLPSTVKETLPKSAEFNIYVRDRKPFVRFTGRAYVLPRTGQRGIPLVSVNTPSVNVNVFRIGDRNLINTVVDSDFQKTLSSYQLSDLGNERGVKVWSGELATASTLNQDVVTAFPVDQALGDLQPGVYVMTAAAKGPGSGDDDGSLATQWFIVSDMGMAAGVFDPHLRERRCRSGRRPLYGGSRRGPRGSGRAPTAPPHRHLCDPRSRRPLVRCGSAPAALPARAVGRVARGRRGDPPPTRSRATGALEQAIPRADSTAACDRHGVARYTDGARRRASASRPAGPHGHGGHELPARPCTGAGRCRRLRLQRGAPLASGLDARDASQLARRAGSNRRAPAPDGRRRP